MIILCLLLLAADPPIVVTRGNATASITNVPIQYPGFAVEVGDAAELADLTKVFISRRGSVEERGFIRNLVVQILSDEPLVIVSTAREADFILDYSPTAWCLVDGSHHPFLESVAAIRLSEGRARVMFKSGWDETAAAFPIPPECLDDEPEKDRQQCTDAWARRDLGPAILFVQAYRRANQLPPRVVEIPEAANAGHYSEQFLSVVRERAGPDAVDCGREWESGGAAIVDACLVNAFRRGDAFFALKRGPYGSIMGVARAKSGHLYFYPDIDRPDACPKPVVVETPAPHLECGKLKGGRFQ